MFFILYIVLETFQPCLTTMQVLRMLSELVFMSHLLKDNSTIICSNDVCVVSQVKNVLYERVKSTISGTLPTFLWSMLIIIYMSVQKAVFCEVFHKTDIFFSNNPYGILITIFKCGGLGLLFLYLCLWEAHARFIEYLKILITHTSVILQTKVKFIILTYIFPPWLVSFQVRLVFLLISIIVNWHDLRYVLYELQPAHVAVNCQA